MKRTGFVCGLMMASSLVGCGVSSLFQTEATAFEFNPGKVNYAGQSTEAILQSFAPKHTNPTKNELNDGQQYIQADGTYGAAIKIFAADPYPDDFSSGVLVAVVQTSPNAPGLPTHLFKGEYTCVYLKIGSSSNDYDSELVSNPNGDCAPDRPNFTTDKGLDVESPGESGVPQAAVRFDWDGKQKHMISFGVPCGDNWDKWCDIAKKKQKRSAHFSGANGKKKLLYDQQYLATDGIAGLQPSDVLGTILPLRGVKATQENYFYCTIPAGQAHCGGNQPLDDPEWKDVAEVDFPGDLPHYKQKFNFDKTTGNSRNRVQLRLDLSQPADYQWQARVIGANGNNIGRTLQVKFADHGVAYSAVRWKWKARDEGMWVRCATGCCEITEDGIAFNAESGAAMSKEPVADSVAAMKAKATKKQ